MLTNIFYNYICNGRKAFAFLYAVLASLVGFGALVLGFFITTVGFQEPMLLAIPQHSSTTTPIATIESVNASPVLSTNQYGTLLTTQSQAIFTYKTTSTITLNALQTNHTASLIETNHSLPQSVGYNIVYGSFFRHEHMQNRSRVAVLNQPAAFALFGYSNPTGNIITMHNNPYLIIGIIADTYKNSEDINIYIPATIRNAPASTVVTNLNINAHLSLDYIKAILQQMGVTDSTHYFEMSTAGHDSIVATLTLATLSTALILLAVASLNLAKQAKVQVVTVLNLRQHMYANEIIKTKETGKLAVLSLFTVLLTIATLSLSLYTLVYSFQ